MRAPTQERATNRTGRTTRSSPDLQELFAKARESQSHGIFGLVLLGLENIDPNQLRKCVERGLEYKSFQRVQSLLGFTKQEAANLVRIPETTLHRRAAEGRLTPDESDRLVRVSKIYGMALELFHGDVGATRRWLESPKTALDGETPLNTAKTEVGARMVEDLIGRIAHGVYT